MIYYYYYWNNKKQKIDLKDKMKDYKNFDKWIYKGKKRNQKKKDQIEIHIILIEKKIKNLIWGIKLKIIKTLTKE